MASKKARRRIRKEYSVIVYIASYPRSGNYWSQAILGHYFGLTTYSVYVSRKRNELLEIFGSDLTESSQRNDPLFLTPHLRQAIAEDKRPFVIKTHELPFNRYYPGEKVIHIVRHPGATLWSYYHYLRDVDHIDVELGGVIQGQYGFGSWSKHTETWLSATQLLGNDYLRYSYEQLHQSELLICQRITELTSLPVLKPLGTLPSFEDFQRERPLLARSGKPDEWQSHFTRPQVMQLLRSHGHTMEKLGYAADPSQIPIARQEVQSLTMQAGNQSSLKKPGQLNRLLKRFRSKVSSLLDALHLRRPYLTLRYAILYLKSYGFKGIFSSGPVVFHITHHKAGSQWVAEVLKYSVSPGRIVLPQQRSAHFSEANIRPGAVILTIYKARPYFEQVAQNYSGPAHKFVVIRDLRDTLVSLYFSLRYSHVEQRGIGRIRERLSEMDQETGFLFLMGIAPRDANNNFLTSKQTDMVEAFGEFTSDDPSGRRQNNPVARIAEIQESWMESDDRLLVRYEELVADEFGVFVQIMDYCNIRVPPNHLRRVVAHNSFAAMTGRNAGDEDIMAHQRKGIVGDWRNYFTDTIKAEFKEQFGQTLIITGYETDLNW